MKSQTTVALKVSLTQLQMSNTFQVSVNVKYPEVATKALKSLLAFPVSHLCEAGFFAVKVKGIQSCPALCNPMDCTVHGILQAWSG